MCFELLTACPPLVVLGMQRRRVELCCLLFTAPPDADINSDSSNGSETFFKATLKTGKFKLFKVHRCFMFL